MSKVAVKRPAQYCLTFDDDNCRPKRFDSNIATERDTGRQYEQDFNNNIYKKALEDLIVAELKKKLEEEARRFKKKWNYDLTDQKFLSGDYCWEAKSAKSFPISYAKHCFYSYYGAQPLYLNSDESGVEPDCNSKSYDNNDSGTVTPQQTTTVTTTDVLSSNDEIATETLTNTNDTRSIGNPVTTICNENAENADGSLRLIPIICYKPRDSEGDILDRQRPN
ncbi:uncharacterized protein LOC118761713 [Octopus sinensis]|uniref:Uncharacterized protein LOC118761713 n=1 Tax=Octopus sinensis TaxID=2607531 RepID=A0A7E6EJH7_9MOLL|nr:uncharacterized protein LOC118761713 [Octopus sinensis]